MQNLTRTQKWTEKSIEKRKKKRKKDTHFYLTWREFKKKRIIKKQKTISAKKKKKKTDVPIKKYCFWNISENIKYLTTPLSVTCSMPKCQNRARRFCEGCSNISSGEFVGYCAQADDSHMTYHRLHVAGVEIQEIQAITPSKDPSICVKKPDPRAPPPFKRPCY